MKFEETLHKMRTTINGSSEDRAVENILTLNGESLAMNTFIGKSIGVSYLNQINCIHCGRKTSKSFR